MQLSFPDKASVKPEALREDEAGTMSAGEIAQIVEGQGLALLSIMPLVISSGQVWVTSSFLMTQFTLLITEDNVMAPLIYWPSSLEYSLGDLALLLWEINTVIVPGPPGVLGLPDQITNFSKASLAFFSFHPAPTLPAATCL